jgi:benzoate-CoA ligase family protein
MSEERPSDHDIICALADDLPVGVWVARAPGGEFVYANRTFAEIMGQSGRDDTRVGGYSEPYGIFRRDGERYPEHELPFVRALQQKGLVVVDDITIHRPDGPHVDVRAFARPIFGKAGDITHVVIAFFDITREVAAERVRHETEKRLARAQRLEAVGTLAGGIAHDFNNLMFGIRLISGELAAGETNPDRRDALALVDDIIERGATLVKALLGFSRRGHHVAAPVALEDLIAEMRELLARTLAGIAIEFDVAAIDRGTVVGDRAQLEQVVMNLVVNARDAVRDADVAPRIAVRCRRDDRHVVLEVVDNGVGIPVALRERVFEPYFTTKTHGTHRGSGLGLATVFGIVEAHGGTIDVDDGVGGRGTTMRVRLPAAAKAAPITTIGVAPAAAAAPAGGTILVVDDDPVVRRALALAVEGLGYAALEAAGGAEAVALYTERRERIHAVVLDVVMPHMNGRATFAALRELDRDVAVIAMSGHSSSDDLRALLDAGIVGFLAKPYSIDDLARELAKVRAPDPTVRAADVEVRPPVAKVRSPDEDVRFPDDFSLADYFLFDRVTEGRGDRIALRFGERSWTYADVADRSRALARALVAGGLAVEQRVYIVLPDTPAFAWSIFGTLAAGGVVTMGNPIVPISDLRYVIDYVRASVVIATPAIAAQLATSHPHVRLLVAPDAATGDDPEASCDVDGATSLDRAIATAAADVALPQLHRDDQAIWLFTSGSTGKPKAAMHSHRDFAFNCEVYAKRTVGYREDDVTVSVPRLFFGYATGTNLWFPFGVGASVGLFSERPTAESIAAAIARYRATIVTNVPTMLGKLLDLDDERRARGEPGVDLSSVRFHLSAGEALPEPLLRRFVERFGGDVYDGIGSAEMFHIYCTNRPGDIKPGSLGRVVDGYELAILPEDAEHPGAPRLPANEIGILWVKGDSVAHGYFRDRDKAWKTFHGHWCRTGDLFHVDGDGYLYFSGRADDLFKVGGVFVAPREVEDCMLAHPAVSVVAVIGAEDDGLTKPKAFVVLRPEARASDREALAAELKAHVQARLSKHKYPRWIEFVEDLPKNDRGKVDKKLLAERERASRAKV